MENVNAAISHAVSLLEKDLPLALERSKDLNLLEFDGRVRCFKFFKSQAFPFEVDDARLSEQIRAAEGGDNVAVASLRVAAAMFLEAGQQLPIPLRQYTAQFLLASIPRPRKHRLQNNQRDGVIFTCINDVIELGFHPTRNAASRGRQDCPLSACAIVAKALCKVGVHLSEEAVEKVWNKMTGPSLIFPRPKQSFRNV